MSSESLILAAIIVGFSIIVAAVAFGSAVGDGIVSSKAVESIARQPEARPNILTFMFIGVGVLEAFPVIALAFALYLFFVVAPVPQMVGTALKSLAAH